MMITQLATVAIRARVLVSLATVPPKIVIRSKRRSRLLASDSLSLPIWAWAISGSRSVRSTRSVLAVPDSLAGASEISNRVVGFAMPAPSRTLANSAATTWAGAWVLLKAVVLKLRGYSRPPANRVVSAGLVLEASPAAALGIGFASPTVISTLARAGPKASMILFLTLSFSCWESWSVAVVRMLNRASLVSLPTRRLSTVTSGRTLAFWRTNSARLDSESDWTVGSDSLSRMVTSVPPVKSMLYIVRPRAKKATRPRRMRISEPAMQY